MYKKPTNILILFLLSFFVFANSVSAVICDRYTKHYTPEELIINDIFGNIFVFLLLLSGPMFVFGVVRDFKTKKTKKNFSIIVFLGLSFVFFLVSSIIIYMLNLFFIYLIYYFYLFNLTYVGIGIYLFILYLLSKNIAKILNADIFVIMSFIFIIAISLISKII
ncbi:hypothetical protein KAK05_00495 [Candidatus Parcubacteria bacterium]|nr:hypothetical protein [Candidatus Parcubacteria bacterium]